MLRHKARVRKGKWADSPANPERRQPRKRDFDKAPKRERKVTDLSGVLRRNMAEEVGEAELSKDHRFTLLMHYGIVAPKIDRKVTKPSWMPQKDFNKKLNEWYRDTKNLVPAIQEKRIYDKTSKPFRTHIRKTSGNPKGGKQQGR